MANPFKRKGSAFERDVVAYLREQGFAAERAYGAGRPDDRGDVVGVDGWTIECKNHAKITLSEWCNEAEAERLNACQRFWAVIFKRKQKPVSAAYVVMDLSTFAELVFKDGYYEEGW